MGFCTDAEHERFLVEAPHFERSLASAGIQILKLYLDVSDDEQERRFKDRVKRTFKRWRVCGLLAPACFGLASPFRLSLLLAHSLCRTHPLSPPPQETVADGHLRPQPLGGLLSRAGRDAEPHRPRVGPLARPRQRRQARLSGECCRGVVEQGTAGFPRTGDGTPALCPTPDTSRTLLLSSWLPPYPRCSSTR